MKIVEIRDPHHPSDSSPWPQNNEPVAEISLSEPGNTYSVRNCANEVYGDLAYIKQFMDSTK
jgi:hypothetical protein